MNNISALTVSPDINDIKYISSPISGHDNLKSHTFNSIPNKVYIYNSTDSGTPTDHRVDRSSIDLLWHTHTTSNGNPIDISSMDHAYYNNIYGDMPSLESDDDTSH